jgi:acyl-CoA thioester hydrolase
LTIGIEDGGEGGIGRDVGRVGSGAGQVFEDAEKQDPHAHEEMLAGARSGAIVEHEAMAAGSKRGAKHEARLRVRYAETDQMGVVYHANYLVWMEIGRIELVRACGLAYRELEASEGLYLAVTEASCRYLYPAKYDQEIVVDTEVAEFNAKVIEFHYRIRSAEPEKALAEGLTRHMWLNREWRPARLPEKYHAALRGEAGLFVEKETEERL